jgi:hypothetical protein
MVEDTLVDRKIEKGRKFLEALDAAGVPIDAALWFYFPESEMWRLVIATPLVKEGGGTREAYRAFQEVEAALAPADEFGASEIRAASRKDPIIKALWRFANPPSRLVGRTFGGAYVDGVDFQGAYLYRAPTRRRASAR